MKGRVKGGRGYLLIDNTNGDVPLVQPQPTGEPFVVKAGTRLEVAVLTCNHCNCTVVLHPKRTRPRAWCRKCNHYVCDAPGCNAGCTPTDLCVDLALKHTGSGIDFLGRTKGGDVLFDRRLADRERIF